MPAAKRDCTSSVRISLRERNSHLAERDAYTLALTEKLVSARIPRASSTRILANASSHWIDANFGRDMTWQAISHLPRNGPSH
jgi:hypothetical protein